MSRYVPVPGVSIVMRNYFKRNGSKGGRTLTEKKLASLAELRQRRKQKLEAATMAREKLVEGNV